MTNPLCIVLYPFYFVVGMLAMGFSGTSTSPIEPEPCKQIIETKMGEICLYSEEETKIVDKYISVYANYLSNKFQNTQNFRYTGRQYSNMRLFCVYKFVIKPDGSLNNIEKVISCNPEFDNFIKNIILDNPPVAFIDGMPAELQVEVVFVQKASAFNDELYHKFLLIKNLSKEDMLK